MFCKHDIFLSKEFHTAVEKSPPSGMKPFYCVISQNNTPIGITYYQVKHLKMSEALKIEGTGTGVVVKKTLANRINFHSIVCGNAMVTGQYGYRFSKKIARDKQYKFMAQSNNLIVDLLKREYKIKVGPVLCKDYYERQLYGTDNFEDYTKFTVQPSMIFEVREEWHSFEDYLGSMKAKYRTRVKRAKKKLEGISRRTLESNDIELLKVRMNELYLNIAKQAGFNLFFLHENYFLDLKINLKDDFKVVGYFKDDILVGFYTLMYNRGNIDAHFLGYDKQYNGPHQLYLNMLYDMINIGIQLRAHKVFMSRTALEIKSSTGAVAHEMFCYLKHTKSIYNRLLPYILNTLVPEEEWLPRSPFK